jgi:hypothetical protein
MSTSLKLFDCLHEEFRRRHYSYETEKSYVHWIKAFIRFHSMTLRAQSQVSQRQSSMDLAICVSS